MTTPASPARRRTPSPLAKFWADDRGLSVFSVALLVTAFVLPPLVPSGGGRQLAGDIVFAILLISGARALGERKLVRRFLMPTALTTLGVYLASGVFTVGEAWVLSASLLSLLLLLGVVLGLTLRSGPITYHRLQGAVAAYLLLGIIWAFAYALVCVHDPQALAGAVSPADGPRAFYYFSFVTLATLGYGDVVPVHPAARSLAIFEAVTGTLYLAILIARLVAQAKVPGQEEEPHA